MKFKEYKVQVGDNPGLSKALHKHAYELGYGEHHEKIDSLTRYDGHYLIFCACGDIRFTRTKRGFNQQRADEVSIRDFFKLTKEDVIEEPERFHTRLQFNHMQPTSGGWGGTIEGNYTQDQIDRIMVIMEEGE